MGRGAACGHRRRRGLVPAIAVAAAVVAGACDGGSSTASLAGRTSAAVKGAATSTPGPLSAFFAEAPVRKGFGPLADALAALLQAAHTAFVAKLVPPTAATRSARSPIPAPATLLSVSTIDVGVIFQGLLADALDPATAETVPAGGIDLPMPAPSSTTKSDGTNSASVTGSASAHLTAAGSVVTVRLDVSEHIVVTDASTGAAVADVASEDVLTGLIDVCPADNGTSAGSLDEQYTLHTSRAGAGFTATGTFGGVATTTGHVDDTASLTGIDGDFSYKQEQSSTSGGGSPATGTGTLGETMSTQTPGGAVGSGAFTSHITGSSATGTVTGNDLSFGSQSAGELFTWLWPSYTEAQRLWRSGRCVVVAVPAYNAQTPVRISAQGTSQHREEVGTGSQTKFTVQLKHRFGGPPRAPVDASITSGGVKLDPLHLDGAPGTLTYTAPGDQGKTASVEMKSTSRRGIGRLVIEFETKPKSLQVSITGTLTTGLSILRVSANVTVGPVVLVKTGDNTWEAQAPIKDSYTFTSPVPCAGSGAESGTVHLTASRQARGDTTVWVVHPDPAQSHVSAQSTCRLTVGNQFSGGGGYALKFLTAVGDVTVPDAGGSVPVANSRNLGISTDTVNATLVGTVTDAA